MSTAGGDAAPPVRQAGDVRSHPPLRLIYVASTGRSGSTLLEMLLGAQATVFTMGEIHLWTHELTRMGVLRSCSCGRETVDCPFWQAVRQRVDPLAQPPPRLDNFRERHDGGKTLRLGMLPEFFRYGDRRNQAEINQYGANNDAAFRAFAEEIEHQEAVPAEWLVDASKDPYRLLWLIESAMFDVWVLQITKIPPAFVLSESKTVFGPPSAPVSRQLRSLIRKMAVWSVVNTLTFAACRRRLASGRYLRVSYEQLAQFPEETMQELSSIVGFPFDPSTIGTFRQRQTHAMAGNAMRQDTRPIVFEERWRTVLPRWVTRAATLMGLPVTALLAKVQVPTIRHSSVSK